MAALAATEPRLSGRRATAKLAQISQLARLNGDGLRAAMVASSRVRQKALCGAAIWKALMRQ